MVFQSRLGYNLHSTHRTTTLFDIRFQRQFSSFFFCNKRIQNNFKWKRQMSFASQRHPEMMEGFDDDYITSMIQVSFLFFFELVQRTFVTHLNAYTHNVSCPFYFLKNKLFRQIMMNYELYQ